jgi:hypothetical protein
VTAAGVENVLNYTHESEQLSNSNLEILDD